MRLILVASLVVAAYAVVPSSVVDRVYQPGWEYVYKYDSHLLTGLPTAGDQYSGFRIKADVQFQFLQTQGFSDGLKVLMKMEDVEIFKVHGSMGREQLPLDRLPEHASFLEHITRTPQGQELITQLTKTCTFVYKSGLIEEIKIQEGEPVWSTNVKKGVMNLLKLKVKPVEHSTYTEREEDILGECETMYTVTSRTPYIEMTKVRRLNSCTKNAIVETGFLAGLSSFDGHKTALEPMAHSKHVLYTEGSDKFSVKNVEMKSSYAFMPFLDETDSVVTYIWQKLECMTVKEIRSQITIPSSLKDLTSLIFDVPHPIVPSMYKRDKYSMDNTRLPETDDTLRVIDDELTTLVKKLTVPFVHDTVPVHILKITQLLRTCTTRDIMTLIRRCTCTDEMCQKKLGVILDIVPTLPTPVAPEIVITLVKEEMVTGVQASMMVNLMTMQAHPTPELVDKCLQLYKLKCMETQCHPFLGRALILGVGTVAHRMSTLHEKYGIDRQLGKPVLRGIVRELCSMLESARTDDEKILLIKTIGNFGDSSFLPVLKTIIEDTRMTTRVRVHAVYAIRKFAYLPVVRDQVIQMVLPIFMNVNEKHELRTACFVIFIKARPTYHKLMLVGHTLQHEPSHQIKTLVYSTYLKIAQCDSQEPWMREMVKTCRKCLKFMKPVEVLPWDTQMMHSEFYSETVKVGGIFEQLLVKSPRSILPQAFYTSLRGTILGQYVNVLETGLDISYLERLVKKVVTWVLTESDISLSSLIRTFSSMEENVKGSYISEEINRILNKLPLDVLEDEEFEMLGFLRIFSNELQYFTFNKNDLISLFETSDMTELMRIVLEGKQFRWHKVVSIVENSLVVPSPIGVPVTLNFTLVHMTSVVGKVKVEGVPSLVSSLLTRTMMPTTPVKMELETDISTPTEIIMSMGADLCFIKTGTATNVQIVSNIPMNVVLSLDPSTMKIETETIFPQQRVDLFKVISEPITFCELVPLEFSSSLYIRHHNIEILPFQQLNLVTPKYYKVMIPLLVLPVNVEFETRLSMGVPMWSAQIPLMGKQEMYLIFNREGVRTPVLKTTIDINDLFHVMTCSEKYGTNYRLNRDDPFADKRENPSSLFGSFSSSSSYISDFVEIKPDSDFKRRCPAIKVPITMTCEDSTTRTVKFLWTWIKSQDWMMHQVNFQMVGKSLYGLPYGFNNIKALTEVVVDFEKMFTDDMTRYPVMKWRFAFGINRFDENKIELKVLKGTPEGIFEDDEVHVQTMHPKVYKLTTVVEHSLVSHDAKFLLEKCWDYVVPYVQEYIRVLPPYSGSRVLSGLNEIKVFVQVVPEWEKVMAVVDVPSGYKYKVNLPWMVPYLKPLTLNSPISLIKPPTTVHKLLDWTRTPVYGQCEITKTSLKTTDGYEVLLPETLLEPTCSTLFARDCSYRNDFNFIMTPVDNKGMKKITLLVPEYKIEIIPKVDKHWYSWRRSVDVEVKVNDEVVSVGRYEPIVLVSKESPRQEPLYIIKEVENMVNVTCVKLGTTLLTDGSVIKMKVSPIYQGQLCGLCGNYNMDPSDDIERVHYDQKICEKQHFMKHFIPSTECKVRGW